METIFITDSQTYIEVPCLVSDPDLKVSLFSVGPPTAAHLISVSAQWIRGLVCFCIILEI